MNDVQLYQKGLKRYDEYCLVCGRDCTTAKGRVVGIDIKREQLTVLNEKGEEGHLSINLKPFCTSFKKEEMTRRLVMDNVKRRDMFKQVVVWEGTVVGQDTIEEFEQFILDELGTRIQYLEEVITFPNKDKEGKDVEDTGGRNDVFFAVHDEDVGKFAIPRLQYGMRWIEDVLSYRNCTSPIYPERVRNYCC